MHIICTSHVHHVGVEGGWNGEASASMTSGPMQRQPTWAVSSSHLQKSQVSPPSVGSWERCGEGARGASFAAFRAAGVGAKVCGF